MTETAKTMKPSHTNRLVPRRVGPSLLALLLSLSFAGCQTPAPVATIDPELMVVPEPLTAPPATVRLVNTKSQFVVIDFSQRQPPQPGTVLDIVRDDHPIAKVRVTEPTLGSHVTADILEGSIRIGDTVR